MVAETARQNAERQRQLEEEEAAKKSQLGEEEAENQSQLEEEAAKANNLTEMAEQGSPVADIAAMKGIGSDSSEDETEGWSF